MFSRLWQRSGFVFGLVFLWKVVLLVFTAQPVPANDAFWYDGPVVHLLNHGGYFNPSLLEGHPISGGEFFCGYPPLHQICLWGWMSIFGTSALAAMWFHLFLIGIYFIVSHATLRHLQVPAPFINCAGLFLLGLTFHDRPDTLACLIGTAIFYATARWLSSPANGGRGWAWLLAVLLPLDFATSIQTGLVLGALSFSTVFVGSYILRRRPPWAALAASALITWTLLAIVIFGFPRLWHGFLAEGVTQNASVQGFHLATVNDVLKLVRNMPAYFALGLLAIASQHGRDAMAHFREWKPREILLFCGTLNGLLMALCCLFATGFYVTFVYLQPIVVGLFLAYLFERFAGRAGLRATYPIVALLAVLVAVRAIGMTTWGAALAWDHGYRQSTLEIRTKIEAVPNGKKVVISSPYLYDADRLTNGNWILADAPWTSLSETFPDALRRIRVHQLVLTQFDYYRRYRDYLKELVDRGEVTLTVRDTAHIRPPDSYESLQRVVQHLSWAPVFVDVEWK